MDSIKDWLDDAGFDWAHGTIIIQTCEDEDAYPGWTTPIAAHVATADDMFVLKQFNAGFGGPECPRFIAEDACALYFPRQYDGATALVVVLKDIKQYLDVKNETPYPGG